VNADGWALVILVVAFGALVAAEAAWPLRRRLRPRGERVTVNLVLAVLAAVTVRFAVVPVGVATALFAERAGVGLVRWLTAAPVLAWPLAAVLLDYTMYLWHRLNHRVPVLWRFHLVHHTDLDLDVSTALRFHAGELLLSCAWRAAQVLVIGPSVTLLLAFEVVFELAAAFHHSNWRLPRALERALGLVVVTPRMHGIHHSVVEDETNSNWSVILSWWDRAHGTLRLDVPQADVTIGLPAYRKPEELRAWRLLALPFTRQRAAWPRAP
jgi:sterol desaturase/sphingolipid hydroxylase (fatty acid hydroxylase superfamily)